MGLGHLNNDPLFFPWPPSEWLYYAYRTGNDYNIDGFARHCPTIRT